MKNEFHFGFVIVAIKENLLGIFLFGLVGGLGIYYFASSMKPWFAHTLMVDSASLGNNAIGLSSSNIPKSLSSFTGGAQENAVKSEGMSYLKFAFMDNPVIVEDENKTAYIAEVVDQRTTDFFQIATYGRTPEEAKAYADKVFSELNIKFQPKIDQILEERAKVLATMNMNRSTVRQNLDKVKALIKQVGFSPVLEERRMQAQVELMRIESEITHFKSKLVSGEIKPFTEIFSRPVSLRAVFPKKGLWSVCAFMAFAGLACFLVIIKCFYDFSIQEMETQFSAHGDDFLPEAGDDTTDEGESPGLHLVGHRKAS